MSRKSRHRTHWVPSWNPLGYSLHNSCMQCSTTVDEPFNDGSTTVHGGLTEDSMISTYTCLHCEQDFEGRSNRHYCSRKCKKAEAKLRSEYSRLRRDQERLMLAAIEAKAHGAHAEMRICINRREREAKRILVLEKRFRISDFESVPQRVPETDNTQDRAVA